MLEVIIPAYNAHETIDTPLASLAMQKARHNILVTIVDDCSDKPYDDIVARYYGLLAIRILSTYKNCGAGMARNVGIYNAAGDYLTFLDADDAFSTPLALSSVISECEKKSPDIFMAKAIQECDNATLLKMDFNSTWIHAKFYRTQFLKENKVYFPPFRYNEDSAFCTLTQGITEPAKILQLDYDIYTWINNKNSTVRAGKDYFSEHIDDFVRGRIWSQKQLLARNKIISAANDAASSLVTLYYMSVDLENGAKEVYDNFCNLVYEYLQILDLPLLLQNKDFSRQLFLNYQRYKFSPRYQRDDLIYFPRIGIIDWYLEILNKGKK